MNRSTLNLVAAALTLAGICGAATPSFAGPVTVPGSGGFGDPPNPTVPANALWYNGDADGGSSFTNQNNAQFQQILYNDFNVTGAGWTITSVWSNNIFTGGPPAATNATWEIRSNMPTGTLVASGDALATLTPTGFTVFGDAEYQVLVSGLSVALAPGTYWLAVYPDDTNGAFAGNDSTSGANAIGTPPGNNGNLFASFDGDATFSGPFDIDTSAGVAGTQNASAVPEPATLALLGIGIMGMAGYGWRRRKQAPFPAPC